MTGRLRTLLGRKLTRLNRRRRAAFRAGQDLPRRSPGLPVEADRPAEASYAPGPLRRTERSLTIAEAIELYGTLALVLSASRLRRARRRALWAPRRVMALASAGVGTVRRRSAGALTGSAGAIRQGASALAGADRGAGSPAWGVPGGSPAATLGGGLRPSAGLRQPRRRTVGPGWPSFAALAIAVAVLLAPSLGIRLPGNFLRTDEALPPVILRSSLPPSGGAEPSEPSVAQPPRFAPAPAPGETYRINWPYDIADGLTFGPEGATKTRLGGLTGPGRDSVCSDRDGNPWACGLQARAALNNVTRQTALTCVPAGPAQADIVPARCLSGDTDIGRELVASGWARSFPFDPAMRELEETAMREERGLWNGGWAVRLPPAR